MNFLDGLKIILVFLVVLGVVVFMALFLSSLTSVVLNPLDVQVARAVNASSCSVINDFFVCDVDDGSVLVAIKRDAWTNNLKSFFVVARNDEVNLTEVVE